MKIAILGASSQIAKDLICSFSKTGSRNLLLYVRQIDRTRRWLLDQGLQHICSVHNYEEYGVEPHDAVINFVGVGDPMRAAEMGSDILNVTMRFDDMVMDELEHNPDRRYIFLSSGAVYGGVFTDPASENMQASISINNIQSQHYYAVAKMYAEVRHRSRPDLAILDLRVFNIFSRTHDINARFLITDIVRAIRQKSTLKTSPHYIVRDFMHPDDFHQLVECCLVAAPGNCAVDCYSREPIDKISLLHSMAQQFGLNYEFDSNVNLTVYPTGFKQYYYSLNRKASKFGYEPRWSSLECILTETAAILDEKRNIIN